MPANSPPASNHLKTQQLQNATSRYPRGSRRGYGTMLVNQVDGTMLRQFVEHEACRVKATTANMTLDSIVQVLKFALAKHYISHVPEVRHVVAPPTDDENEDSALSGSPIPTREEVRKIIESAKVRLTPTERTKSDGRPIYLGLNQNDYSDLYSALCLTGMRIGEAIHLTWNDVDWTSHVIRIRPGKKNGIYWRPKTTSSIRCIAMIPELEELLKRLQRTNRRNNWVFESKRGTKFYSTNVQKRLRDICTELGFEKHFTPHSLRKYWASTVAIQGMDTKVMIKMFGHTDFKLILRVYFGQNDFERLVAETSKIDFGLQGRTPDTNSDTDEQGEWIDGSVA